MNARSIYTFRLLGTVDLRHADDRSARSVLAHPKRVALLAYLALEARDGWVSREKLATLFWPDAPTDRARTSLRGSIHFLRQFMGRHVIEGSGANIRLSPGSVDCDAARLTSAAEQGDHVEVLELYSGVFLDGFNIQGAPEFESWQAATRRRLHEAAVQAALALGDVEEAAGRSGAAVSYLRRAVSLQPENEDVVRRLLRALDLAGDRAGALAAYGDWSAELRKSLELEPSPETVALVDTIREGRSSGQTGATAPGPGPASRDPAIEPHPAAPSPGAPETAPAPTSRSLQGGRDRRRVHVVGRWGAVVVLAGLVAWLAHAAWPGTLLSGARARSDVLAVFPFAATGSAPADVAAAMPFLLEAPLGFSKTRVLDPGAVRAQMLVQTDADPMGVAKNLGAGRVLTGSVRSRGTSVVLDARLRWTDHPTRDVRTARVEGALTDVPALAIQLVKKLMPDLLIPGASAPPAMTRDVRALKPFIDGEKAFRSGRYAAAESAYTKAVRMDSTFALASYRRSVAAEWIGSWDTARVAADRALAASYRLSSHERVMLDAWRSYLWGDVKAALTAYDQLVSTGPADSQSWLRLAELRFHWGSVFGVPPAAADTAFATFLRLSPGDPGAALHRLRLAGRRGDLSMVQTLSPIVGAGTSPDERAEIGIRRALLAGKPPDTADVRTLVGLSPDVEWNVLAEVSTSIPDPRPLVTVIRNLPPTHDLTRELQRAWLSSRILAGTGRYAAADSAVASIAAADPDRALELRAALALTAPALPAPDVAAKMADRLWVTGGSVLEPGVRGIAVRGIYTPRRVLLAAMLERVANRMPFDSARTRLEGVPGRFTEGYRAILIAWNAWLNKDAAGVLDALGQPAAAPDGVRPGPLSYTLALSRWLRVQALLQLGRDAEALRWIEGFPEPNGSDLMFLARARLVEAQILERANRRSEAAVQYQRVLELLRGADPEADGFVQKARSGLARVTR